MVALGAWPFNLASNCLAARDAGVPAEVQAEGVGKQEGEHGLLPRPLTRDVGAPLLPAGIWRRLWVVGASLAQTMAWAG